MKSQLEKRVRTVRFHLYKTLENANHIQSIVTEGRSGSEWEGATEACGKARHGTQGHLWADGYPYYLRSVAVRPTPTDPVHLKYVWFITCQLRLNTAVLRKRTPCEQHPLGLRKEALMCIGDKHPEDREKGAVRMDRNSPWLALKKLAPQFYSTLSHSFIHPFFLQMIYQPRRDKDKLLP